MARKSTGKRPTARGSRAPVGKKKAAKGMRAAAAKEDDVGLNVSTIAQWELNIPQERDRVHWYKTIKGFTEKLETAKANLREQWKKAGEVGIDTAALKDIMKMERADPLAVQSYFAQLSGFFRDRGMPIQFQLFDPKFGDSLKQAAAEGRNAGENGRSPECRWPEESPEADAYMAAWVEANTGLVNPPAEGQATH